MINTLHLLLKPNLMIRLFTLFLLIATTLISCSQSQQKSTDNTPVETLKNTNTANKPKILFFGNSITAGYNLQPSEAFSAIIQQKIDSMGYSYTCINAGVSGETTSAGLERIEWVMDESVEIFVLELGANDGLRGLPTQQTQQNLLALISKARLINPDVEVILAGMEVPPNMGDKYFNEFHEIFPAVQKEAECVLIPFLLDGVAGISELNLPDGIHPNIQGHKIVAETVWQYLQPLLKKAEV